MEMTANTVEQLNKDLDLLKDALGDFDCRGG